MRYIFHVINVQSHLYKLVILRGIEEPKLVRKLLHVTSVYRHFHKIAIIKFI